MHEGTEIRTPLIVQNLLKSQESQKRVLHDFRKVLSKN